MQARMPSPQQSQDICQMDIFSDEQLRFNVRVSCGGKRFVAGGFLNPDEAQRRGVAALLAMNGFLERRNA